MIKIEKAIPTFLLIYIEVSFKVLLNNFHQQAFPRKIENGHFYGKNLGVIIALLFRSGYIFLKNNLIHFKYIYMPQK